MSILYDLLLVNMESSQDEIHRSFRTLAKKYHPDMRKERCDEFLEINEAYSILKDPYKRDYYDMFGDSAIKYLKDDRLSYLLTRLFDRKNLNIFSISVVLTIPNILFLPFIIRLKNSGIIPFYVYTVSPIILAILLLLIPAYRSMKAMYARQHEYRREVSTFLQIHILSLLIISSAMMGLLKFDEIIDVNTVTVILPYIIFEVFLDIRNVRDVIRNGGPPKKKCKLFYHVLARVFSVMVLSFDVPIECKCFVPAFFLIFWFTIEMVPLSLFLICLTSAVSYSTTLSLVMKGLCNSWVYLPMLIPCTLAPFVFIALWFSVISSMPSSRYIISRPGLPLE
jgi:hypothetical protein